MSAVPIAKAANEIGVDRTTLLTYRDLGMPVERRKNRLFVDVSAARAWMASRGLTGARGVPDTFTAPSPPDEPPDEATVRKAIQRAELAKRSTQANKLKVELNILKRDWIPADDLRDYRLRTAQLLRSALSHLPRQAAIWARAKDVRELEKMIEAETARIAAVISGSDDDSKARN